MIMYGIMKIPSRVRLKMLEDFGSKGVIWLIKYYAKRSKNTVLFKCQKV